MAPASVSFRISRNAEDLAETIHALSQRLVTLEQRLAAVELQASNQARPDPQELASLDNVERLLQDCRHLLEIGVPSEAPAAFDSQEDVAYPTAA
ncbi:hypothetical protein [Cyanobium gracile]|uniref:Uncharacterized protein n=1 Tax=Cyanobium gracile (strain ATCC 27147 / PCC 6307) TaxID=292564 RepID=K9P7R2_CYAGP|nr:hypothetical protein [Cyanobium gracile]AFY29427.1 hypothetical protein Cyagr_2318 [Cyanobium gracile PCC 6307]